MKKKIVAACLVICLLATAVIGTTLAYFTDSDDVTNTFTVGNVDITLTEPAWDAKYPSGTAHVYPGEVVDKDPTVSNVGESACLVRVSVTGWDCFGAEAGDIVPGTLGRNWELHDGYYYYKEVLEPEGSTSAVFGKVTIPTGITNETEGTFALDVFAEAVQSEGFEGNVTSVTDLAAWFDTCMG